MSGSMVLPAGVCAEVQGYIESRGWGHNLVREDKTRKQRKKGAEEMAVCTKCLQYKNKGQYLDFQQPCKRFMGKKAHV